MGSTLASTCGAGDGGGASEAVGGGAVIVGSWIDGGG